MVRQTFKTFLWPICSQALINTFPFILCHYKVRKKSRLRYFHYIGIGEKWLQLFSILIFCIERLYLIGTLYFFQLSNHYIKPLSESTQLFCRQKFFSTLTELSHKPNAPRNGWFLLSSQFLFTLRLCKVWKNLKFCQS